MTEVSLRLGLLVNPFAGIGGSVALKGSDGADIRDRALALGAELRAPQRARRAMAVLQPVAEQLQVSCLAGAMGEESIAGLGFNVNLCGASPDKPGTAEDTRRAARVLVAQGLDILVFAGGDGTARDVLDAVGDALPVLGIPAGVKMHSGVYAVSPEAAGELLLQLVGAGLVNLQRREVRDIDEQAFRDGVVSARYYGELWTPEEGRFLQHTKGAGVESEELVAQDIAADVVEGMQADTLYLLGPGSTTAAILAELGLSGTLLGVDVVLDGKIVQADATEAQLLNQLHSHRGPSCLVVTAIGGQGHIFGRGNQQFSPAVIRAVGLDHILLVAGKGKIKGLEGRPLLVDTNDLELDRALCGYRRVITGYHDAILYPVATLP
jgi:predicted polyphosphate/ATP-dependent NAD kinase